MNEPIISPWIFYWIEVIDEMKTCFGIMGSVISVTLVLLIIFSMNDDFDYFVEHKEEVQRAKKMAAIFLALAIPLNCILPTRATMYKMLAASYMTQENIENVGESIDKIADKLVEKINQVKK